MASNSFLWCWLLLSAQFHDTSSDCKYAVSTFSSVPAQMGHCNSLDWGYIVYSYSKNCDVDGGWMYYKLYYEEDCPNDKSKYHTQNSSTRCYIDTTSDCDSVELNMFKMTYSNTIGNDECNAVSDDEMRADFWIYDKCLWNPNENNSSVYYPYIKGEYYSGSFGTGCYYTLNYYDDDKCKDKLDSKTWQSDTCIPDGNDIPWTYSYPDCAEGYNILNIICLVGIAISCLSCCGDMFMVERNKKTRRNRNLCLSCFGCYCFLIWTLFALIISVWSTIRDVYDACPYNPNEVCVSSNSRTSTTNYGKNCSGECASLPWTYGIGYVFTVVGIAGTYYIIKSIKDGKKLAPFGNGNNSSSAGDSIKTINCGRGCCCNKRNVRSTYALELQQKRERDKQMKKERKREEKETKRRAKQKNKQINKQNKTKSKSKTKTKTKTKIQKQTNNSLQIANGNDNNNNYNNDDMIKTQGTLSYSVQTCVICLDGLNNGNEIKLNCGHKFHELCIEEYKESNRSICPLCRKKFVQ